MPAWSARYKGPAIDAFRDVQYITSMADETEYDPAWSWVDPNGHEHSVAGPRRLTLVEWVVTDTYWCDLCRDEHQEVELRCSECGVVIPDVPTVVVHPAGVPFPVCGPWEYTLTDVNGATWRITEAEFLEWKARLA